MFQKVKKGLRREEERFYNKTKFGSTSTRPVPRPDPRPGSSLPSGPPVGCVGPPVGPLAPVVAILIGHLF